MTKKTALITTLAFLTVWSGTASTAWSRNEYTASRLEGVEACARITMVHKAKEALEKRAFKKTKAPEQLEGDYVYEALTKVVKDAGLDPEQCIASGLGGTTMKIISGVGVF